MKAVPAVSPSDRPRCSDMCQATRTTITVTSTGAGDGEVSCPRGRLEAVQNRTDLQADEDERQHVQQEDHRLPHGA